MRRHIRHGIAVAAAIALCLVDGRSATAAPSNQSARLHDIDALIRIVHHLASRFPSQTIDIDTIAIVKPFAIVEWYTPSTRQSIENHWASGGGPFVARVRDGRWAFYRRLPIGYSADTLTHLVPGLAPTSARTLIDAARIGLSLRGCNPDGRCRSTTQTIAYTVVHDAMYHRGFGFAPVVAPIVRDGNLALADYTAGESGGEAMLRYDGSHWKILAMGGGSMNSVGWLSESFRLPTSVARRLVNAMKQREAATYSDLCVPKRRCLERERSATTAFLNRFAKAGGAPPKAAVRAVAMAGTNALLYYGNGKTGGEALLQLRHDRWKLRAMGTTLSLADSELLVRTFGISPENAARLAYKINGIVQ